MLVLYREYHRKPRSLWRTQVCFPDQAGLTREFARAIAMPTETAADAFARGLCSAYGERYDWDVVTVNTKIC